MDQTLSDKLKRLCNRINENSRIRNTSYLIKEYHKVVHKYLIGLPPRLLQASHSDYGTRYIWYKYHPNVCGSQTLDICVETHLWDNEEDQLVHPRTPQKVNNRIGFALSDNEYHGTAINLDALHTPMHHRSKGITAPIELESMEQALLFESTCIESSLYPFLRTLAIIVESIKCVAPVSVIL